jgi:hypothetical protein
VQLQVLELQQQQGLPNKYRLNRWDAGQKSGILFKKGDIMYSRTIFKKVKQLFNDRSASTTAEVHSLIASTDTGLDGNPIGNNFSVTIQCTTGTMAFCFSTAITSTQGFHLFEHGTIDLKVKEKIYFCASSTTPRYQAIVWEN